MSQENFQAVPMRSRLEQFSNSNASSLNFTRISRFNPASLGMGIALAALLTACGQQPEHSNVNTSQVLMRGEYEVNKCLVMNLGEAIAKPSQDGHDEAVLNAADKCEALANMYARVIRVSHAGTNSVEEMAKPYEDLSQLMLRALDIYNDQHKRLQSVRVEMEYEIAKGKR